MATTFTLTLLIPLQFAVLVGVGISVILYVSRQSNTVNVMRWVIGPDSPLPLEVPPPAALPPGEVVVLNVYGSLFFASAPIFEAQLPAVEPDSKGAAVVLRLRGKDDVGSHFLIAGVGDRVLGQLSHTGALDIIGEDNVFPADRSVGTAVSAALERARTLVATDTAGA